MKQFYKSTPGVVSEEELKKEENGDDFFAKLSQANEKTLSEPEPVISTIPVRKVQKDLKWEIFIVAMWVLACSLLSLLGIFAPIDITNVLTFGSYQFAADLLVFGTLIFMGITLVSQILIFILNPPGKTPKFNKVSSLVYDVILTIAGVAGFDVLLCIFVQYASFPIWLGFYVSSVIALTYDYFITKLFAYDKISDKNMFWEIVRFALVGVIAGVFDFLTTYATRILLGKTEMGDTAITFVAVTMGFIVGVIVNYLCSVYMVYKASKKSSAKKWYGVLLFVALSAVGLGIGIGLEALFYDFLHWTYIVVFIVRTLVVMVWNYISRKLVIFK